MIALIVLFSIRRVRESQTGLIWGAACILGGVGLNRTNVALLGYEAPGATAYVPHWIEIVISIAAIAAGILLFALAVRFLPILPQADGDRTESQPPHWSRRALVFVGGALSLLTIAVVLLLQPLTQAQASKTEPLPEAETASVQVCSCTDCHLEIEALVEAGASQDNLAALQIELQPAEMLHSDIICIDCHPDLDFELAAGTQCADCHQAPDADHYGPNCEDCHSPAGFADARLPAEMHPFPLQGAHQYAACEGCHAADQSVPEFVCSNCHDRPENHLPGECSLCHTPEGWAQSIAYVVNLSPQISHELEGRQDCLMCHSVDGEIAPAPNNHGDYINEQCTLCHKTP